MAYLQQRKDRNSPQRNADIGFTRQRHLKNLLQYVWGTENMDKNYRQSGKLHINKMRLFMQSGKLYSNKMRLFIKRYILEKVTRHKFGAEK